MNYFAHYYFDRIDGDTYHSFGLLLPDLVRNFLPGQKLFPITEIPSAPREFQSLALGQNMHFHRDKVFHSSEYFEAFNKEFSSVLKPVFEAHGLRRYWFAGHVLAELMTDRVLIKESDDLIDKLYLDLRACDMHRVIAFLNTQGIIDPESFRMRMDRFFEYEYLKRYIEDSAMTYSLMRICMYAKVSSEWTENQTAAVSACINPLESRIFENLNALKVQMQ